jgi:hypothetical protein
MENELDKRLAAYLEGRHLLEIVQSNRPFIASLTEPRAFAWRDPVPGQPDVRQFQIVAFRDPGDDLMLGCAIGHGSALTGCRLDPLLIRKYRRVSDLAAFLDHLRLTMKFGPEP